MKKETITPTMIGEDFAVFALYKNRERLGKIEISWTGDELQIELIKKDANKILLISQPIEFI